MVKRRFSALFLTLTLLLCTLPAAAAEGDDWLVPKVQEAPAFTDITGVWCEDAVQTVCQTGLMQGRSDGSFNPSGALTGAHIVTICARLYDLLTGGDGTLQEPAADQAWYDPAYKSLAEALDYAGGLDALRINIHPDKYSIRRWQFVELLDQTLTAADVTLPAINQITVLPDTTETAVLKLCSAGILTGSDQYGSFRGNESLSRGQAAAILARLADPAQRQTFTPEPFDLCADVLGVDGATVLLTVGGESVTAELFAYNLCDALSGETAARRQLWRTPFGTGASMTPLSSSWQRISACASQRRNRRRQSRPGRTAQDIWAWALHTGSISSPASFRTATCGCSIGKKTGKPAKLPITRSWRQYPRRCWRARSPQPL